MSAESSRPVRAAAVKQRETVREAFSVSGELPMPMPTTPSQPRAPPVQSYTPPPRNPNSHKKREPPQIPPAPEQLGMAKKRKLTMMAPLDVKEFLDNDAKMGLTQRVGDGPERPMTAELLFLIKAEPTIRQPNGRGSWTTEEIALGIAELFRRLAMNERAAYERRADDMLQRYKEEWRKINKGGAEGQQKGGHTTAFEIFDANNRKLFEQQHPGLSHTEIGRRLRKAFDELPADMRRPYTFLAERDRERVRVHRTLWHDKAQSFTGSEPHKQRDFVEFSPQYCMYCGNSLINTREKSCQSCGKVYESKIVAFAIGGHKEGQAQANKGSVPSATDESTLVTVD